MALRRGFFDGVLGIVLAGGLAIRIVPALWAATMRANTQGEWCRLGMAWGGFSAFMVVGIYLSLQIRHAIRRPSQNGSSGKQGDGEPAKRDDP